MTFAPTKGEWWGGWTNLPTHDKLSCSKRHEHNPIMLLVRAKSGWWGGQTHPLAIISVAASVMRMIISCHIRLQQSQLQRASWG